MSLGISLAQYPLAFVVAHSTGCSHCLEYLPIVREVAPAHGHVPTVLVDIAMHPAMVEALGVQVTPTTVVLRHGRIVDSREGIVDAKGLRALYAEHGSSR
jgi:thioredoxin-like negative regulator of GroEL